MNCKKCIWPKDAGGVLHCIFPHCIKEDHNFKYKLEKIIMKEKAKLEALEEKPMRNQLEIMRSKDIIKAAIKLKSY